MNGRRWSVLMVLLAVTAFGFGCASGGDGGGEPAEESLVFEITPDLITFGQEGEAFAHKLLGTFTPQRGKRCADRHRKDDHQDSDRDA